MAKSLPKTLFVKHVQDGDCSYFESSENKKELWDDMESWTLVGEYKLVKTSKIRGTVETKSTQ